MQVLQGGTEDGGLVTGRLTCGRTARREWPRLQKRRGFLREGVTKI